ncbi:MAG: hypothetical protein ACOWW1_01170 [archaeon]
MIKYVKFVVMMLFFTVCIVSPVYAEASWDIQTLSEDAAFLGYGFCPIEVDSKGNPHIAYTGSAIGNYVGYVSWNGSGWDSQKITGGNIDDFVLDANDNPHITYGSLGYLSWNETQWNDQLITTEKTVYSSLALDSNGNPHVAYITGDKLKYATKNDQNWTIQTVTTDKLPDDNPRFSLALDSNDTPYIMYQVRPPVELKLAVLKNSSWSIENILPSSNFTRLGNMILDSKDQPHFLAKQVLTPEGSETHISNVVYVLWNGSSWNTQTVTSDVSLTNLGLLRLDSDDRPHILHVISSGQLMYSRWTDTKWESHLVGGYALDKSLSEYSIALDSNKNPHISFQKLDTSSANTTFNLMYATAELPPIITVSISLPENKTYTTNEISLTFATNNQTSIVYSLDGTTNVSITENATLTGLSNGVHNLVVYALDENGKVGAFDTVYFTVDVPELPLFTIAVIVVLIIVCAALLIFFKTRKHTSQNQ